MHKDESENGADGWRERKKEGIKIKECEVVRLGREVQRNYGREMVKRGGGMQVEKESV